MRDRVFPWGRVLDEGSSRGKVDEWLHQIINKFRSFVRYRTMGNSLVGKGVRDLRGGVEAEYVLRGNV